MRKLGYLIVEGPHDVEFVYRLLTNFGMDRIILESELDDKMLPLIPRTFPHKGDLLKRMPVPLFVQNESHVVAIHSAIGDSQLVSTFEENQQVLTFSELTGVGLMFDSDMKIGPVARYDRISRELKAKNTTFPKNPGEVLYGNPRLGAFVFPDNANKGTLEDVLLDCAASAYTEVLQHARQYVDNTKARPIADGEDLSSPVNGKKAIVGSIATILRPGKSVQVSIQDNAWLKGRNLQLPRVAAVLSFLKELLDLA